MIQAIKDELFRAWVFKKTYRNWASLLIQIWSGKERVFAVLKDGHAMILNRFVAMALPGYYLYKGVPEHAEEIVASNPVEAALKLYGWNFDGDVLYKDFGGKRVKFLAQYGGEPAYQISIMEIFDMGIYDVNVSGKDVVDIGTGIGDSTIYFSLKGANRVVGVEPLPKVYNVARVNISLNADYVHNISIMNGAIAYNVKDVSVPDVPILYSGSVRVKNEVVERVKVPAYTVKHLAEVVNRDVIKIDCEGCEREIFKHEQDIIGEFDVIIMELHGRWRLKFDKLLSSFREKYKYEATTVVKGLDEVFVMKKKK